MTLRVLLLLLLALFLGWQFLPWQAALPQAAARLQALQPTATPSATNAPTAPGANAARRCEGAQGRIEYVTGPCPPGTRERALGGGTVNVLPAVPVARPADGADPTHPAASAASAPLLRRLSDPEGTAAMQRKALERLNP